MWAITCIYMGSLCWGLNGVIMLESLWGHYVVFLGKILRCCILICCCGLGNPAEIDHSVTSHLGWGIRSRNTPSNCFRNWRYM